MRHDAMPRRDGAPGASCAVPCKMCLKRLDFASQVSLSHLTACCLGQRSRPVVCLCEVLCQPEAVRFRRYVRDAAAVGISNGLGCEPVPAKKPNSLRPLEPVDSYVHCKPPISAGEQAGRPCSTCKPAASFCAQSRHTCCYCTSSICRAGSRPTAAMAAVIAVYCWTAATGGPVGSALDPVTLVLNWNVADCFFGTAAAPGRC